MRKLLTAAVLGTSLALAACDTAEEAEPAAEDTMAEETPAPVDPATPEPTDTTMDDEADTTMEDEPAAGSSNEY